jgi:hypothetical protein
MVRRILCIECGLGAQLHAEDINLGWEQRRVEGVALKPVLLCDQCGTELPEGHLSLRSRGGATRIHPLSGNANI